MRNMILTATLVALVSPAFAQIAVQQPSQPPSDQEILDAHTLCNQPGHTVQLGTINNRPANAGQYKPEWQSCVAIESEYSKRSLATTAKKQNDLNGLSSIVGRIAK